MDRPTCHDSNAHASQFGSARWEIREAKGCYGVNLRHCSYCGSLHPDDLLTALKAGARLDRSDMKYGWPHKFYVHNIPNPLAGEIVQMGSKTSWDEVKHISISEPIMAPAAKTLTVKFYNEHLQDVRDPSTFNQLSDHIFMQTGVHFKMVEGKLCFGGANHA